VKESKGITQHDPVFDMVITFFENTATFTQRIKLTGNKGTTITGEVEFMVCDDTNCLPPTYVDLNFKIPDPAAGSATTITTENNKIVGDTDTISENDEIAKTNEDTNEIAKTSKETTKDSSLSALEQNKKEEQKGLWTIFIV